MVQHVNEEELLEALRCEVKKLETFRVYIRFGEEDVVSQVDASDADEFCQMLRGSMSFCGQKKDDDILPHLLDSHYYREGVPVWEWGIAEFGYNDYDEECIYQMQIDFSTPTDTEQ